MNRNNYYFCKPGTLIVQVVLTVLLSIAVGSAEEISTTEVRNIGSRRELLVDDYLVDQLNGVELKLQKPIMREVALVHDEAWEGNVCCYHTVFQDGDIYRMYYRGAHYDEEQQKQTHTQVVCYAQSSDGINWEKPKLNIVDFEGSKNNNIIWTGIGAHNFSPFKDANPAAKADEKYKAVGSGPGGLYIFKSPDSIHWSLLNDKPVITEGDFDSQNLAFWDATHKRYVDFHRKMRNGYRDIMTCTSNDFINWTDPVWLDYPDAPPEHLYTNQIVAYSRAPHFFLGFPKRFIPSRNFAGHHYPGVSDGVFMTSRDGRSFKRWTEAVIRPGLQKERWVNRNNMTAWGIVVTKSGIPGTGNELSIYSTEGYYRGKDCQIRRFTYRLDGFVSLNAPYKGGEMVSKPLIFTGKELVVNFSTSAAGSILVEIQNASSEAVEGYKLDDCRELVGDEIERTVIWKNSSDVSKLAGKPVRLRILMKDADLYSLRFK